MTLGDLRSNIRLMGDQPRKMITHNDQTLSLSQWASKLNTGYHTLHNRVRSGWSDEDVIETPIRQRSIKVERGYLCNICGTSDVSLLIKKFDKNKQHAGYYRRCRSCEQERWYEWRANPSNLCRVIYKDISQRNRLLGTVGDLTIGDIAVVIKDGCSYCGEAHLRMTLDRIDNSTGYIKANVTSACIRCNLTRNSMPYEAWLCVAKGMKEAREKKLFGEWRAKPPRAT